MNDPSLSKSKFLELISLFRKYQKILSQENPLSLNTAIKLIRIDHLISEEKYEPYLFPVTQNRGFYFWLDIAKEKTAQFEQDFHDAMNTAIDNMTLGMECKKTLPCTIVDIVIEQCKERMHSCKNMRCAQSLEIFIYFLSEKYYPCCQKDIGLHCITKSDAEYESRLEFETTLPLTAQTVYNMGLHEMQKTISKMQKLDIKSSHQVKYKRLKCHHDIDSALKEHKDTIEYEQSQFFLSESIGNVTTDNSFKTTTFCDKNRAHAYYVGPKSIHDGGKLAFNMACTHDVVHIPNIIAHEIFPGHHLEVSNNFKNWFGHDLWYYTHFTSYIEGWALYCETLRTDLDIPHQAHQLQMELLRDARLVIDAGINSHNCGKWTFDESLTFLKTGKFRGKFLVMNFTGFSFSQQELRTEILRCVARPGYGASYKIGKLYFSHWKEMASAQGFTDDEIHSRFLSRRVPLILFGELFKNPSCKDNIKIDTQTHQTYQNRHIEHTNQTEDTKHAENKQQIDSFTRALTSKFSPTHAMYFNHQLLQSSCF